MYFAFEKDCFECKALKLFRVRAETCIVRKIISGENDILNREISGHD